MLSWLAVLNHEIVYFLLIDVLFGKFDIDEDFIVINYMLLLAKFFIYRSKLDNTKPSLEVFKAKLKATLNIEFVIAKRNGQLAQHYKKWESFISITSQKFRSVTSNHRFIATELFRMVQGPHSSGNFDDNFSNKTMITRD